jgi:hypothetical protein
MLQGFPGDEFSGRADQDLEDLKRLAPDRNRLTSLT